MAASCATGPKLDNDAVIVFAGDPLRRMGPAFRYFDDADEALTFDKAIERFRDRRTTFQSTPNDDHISLPYSTTVIWAAAAIRNDTSAPAFLLPPTNTPWLRVAEIYWVVPDCSIQLLLNRGERTLYRADDYVGTFLTGRPFRLNAGDQGTLLVRYGSYGLGTLPLSIETQDSIDDMSRLVAVKLAVFYTVSIAILLLFIGLNIALAGSGTFLLAAGFGSALTLIAQIDGLLFAYVWPNAPVWNKDASFYILTAATILFFITAAHLIGQSRHHRFGKLLDVAAAVTAIPLLLAPVVDIPTLTLFALILCPVAIAAVAFATIMWARGVRLQLTMASVSAAAIGLLMMAATVAMILGSSRATFLGHDLAKAVYLIISMTLMIAFTTRARAINLEYRASLEREIVAVRRDAELNQALLESERAYNRARDLAEVRLARLADTSHDLRQPIAALRLAVDRLGFEGRTDEQHALQRALAYVENVLVQNLEHATDENAPTTDQTDMTLYGTPHEIEVFPVSLVLQSVEAMFRREVEAKALQLRIVGSSLTISGALTPLLQIVCNLVSNAIRFTRKGKVLVGVLRRDGICEIVIADTGIGIAEVDRERLLQRSEKSQESAGHGLGLAIAHRLASENGIVIAMSSAPGAGTCFRLRIR